jgi:hypothetical protein
MTSEAAQLAAEALTKLLGLDKVNVAVVDAKIFGDGNSASAVITLSNGKTIDVDKIANFVKPSWLAVALISAAGTRPQKLNGKIALDALEYLQVLATHIESATADDIARDWGLRFLAVADRIDVDMNDQAQRWAAFEALDIHEPVEISRAGGSSIARCSRVLAGIDGNRYVRTGWFRAHVRSEDSTVSPTEIANRMIRIGWQRPGTKGHIKATRPNLPGTLWQAFYIVAADWENDGWVTLGDPSSAHAHARTPARNQVPPGVTSPPALEAIA